MKQFGNPTLSKGTPPPHSFSINPPNFRKGGGVGNYVGVTSK